MFIGMAMWCNQRGKIPPNTNLTTLSRLKWKDS